MTTTQDLKRYKYGYSSDEWGMGRSLGLIPDPAGNVCLFSDAHDKLEAAQAEIEAQQHRIQALWMERDVVRVERDKALARLAELTKQEPVAAQIRVAIASESGWSDWREINLSDADREYRNGVETRKLYAAAGASPQPRQDLSLNLLERLSKTLTRLGYATPEGGMEHFNADLANQLYNLCRAVDNIFDRVQPSQADAQDAARYRWLREYLPSDDLQYDDNLVLAKTGEDIDAAIDAAINAKEQSK